MFPKNKKPSIRPIRFAAIVAMLESFVLSESKTKLSATQIKVALDLLKLREAQKKRASDSRARRELLRDKQGAGRDKFDAGRDIDALLKELE